MVRQGHDSRAIANKILETARGKGQGLTIMQLVKLIYFGQGWNLAFNNKPLTFHKAQAWQYGPVYPLVYKAFPLAGSQPLDGVIINKLSNDPYDAMLADDELALVDKVVDDYGKMHAFDLSKQTHALDGPWKKTITETGLYTEIPDSLMQSYFKRFIKDGE